MARDRHNGAIARSRTTVPLRQLAVVGLVVAGLVVLSFLADDGDGGGDGGAVPPTVGTVATTTTFPGVFPPAGVDGVCGLLTRAEAQTLVGHDLANDPVEPLAGQCSWPDEPGEVVGELYVVVREREPVPLREALARDWGEERFRLEAGPDLGDDAWYVVRLTDPEEGTEEFVVGLSVHVGDLHVVIGNGGRPSWEGDPPAVKDRLAAAMRLAIERIPERFG